MEKTKRPNKSVKKVFTKHSLRVFSRHPSHSSLRQCKLKLPFLACLRLGSTNPGTLPYKVEINSADAIKKSSNKLLMKTAFYEKGVKTAKWIDNNTKFEVEDKGLRCLLGQNDHEEYNGLEFPIVAKSLYGSRGKGNSLLKNKAEFEEWRKGKNLTNFIFEKFYNYTREYRLHVDAEGCFYTCRKMLKEGTPDDQKWHRHDSNCVWIMEENPQFDKPTNWNLIVEHSVKALNAVGLDVGAIDLKIQSSKDAKGNVRKEPDFIVIEINSAPSFGDVTLEKYKERIPIIANRKYQK